MQGYPTTDMLALHGMANRRQHELEQTLKLKEVKTKAAHAAQSNVVGTYRRVAERNHLGSYDFSRMTVSICTIVVDACII